MDKNYKYDVFISYSRKDTAVADKIVKAFEKAGITCFIDKQGIGGGLEFPAVLSKAIRDSRVFLFLASKNSYESKFAQSEIVYAFNKKKRQDIIPYIIDESNLPDELEFTFSAINWRRMSEHPIDTVLVNDVLRAKRERGSDTNQELADNQQEQIVASPQNAMNKATSFFSKFNGKKVAIVVLALSIIFLLITFLAPESFKHDHYWGFVAISSAIFYIIFGCTVIGLIRPATLGLNKRSEVAKFYATAMIINFCTMGAIDPDYAMDNINTVDSTEQVIQIPQGTNTDTPKD